MAGYDFKAIEAKWQVYWAEHGTFVQPSPGDDGFADAPKLYVLDMFPYPSGAGLHVGHPEGYTATDIVCRYARHKGYNVLHPMGYDAFGLPAEQYAVEHGVHPRETTAANIANIERQIKMFGFSYDWSRRLSTTDPDYYRWTQWIFLQLFDSWYDPQACAARPIDELVDKLDSGDHEDSHRYAEMSPAERRSLIDSHRLAYMDEVPVNWCPKLGTVLANEEVTNEGRSERGDHPVYRRAMKQWMLRITAYAGRLEDDLAMLNWPEPIKIMQRNWIGKSTGAEVDLAVESGEVIRVYTTRPDTLFGATYMVLSPEHPMVGPLTGDEQRMAMADYVRKAAQKTELERMADTKDKSGVFTGAYAINPVNGERLPIYVADYVMISYGTGAIMAVPAHDQRDWAFAVAHGLPVRAILKYVDELDARYVAVLHHDDFVKAYNTFRAKPKRFPAVRGIDFGPITHEMETGAGTFIPNEGDDRLLYSSTGPKSWIFVGPDGINDLIQETHLAISGPTLPLCEPTLSDDLEYVESGLLNGLSPSEGKEKITVHLEQQGLAARAVKYKLRDWLFSRQRYWGEPFPIVHCPQCGLVPLAADDLPLLLPEMADFTPATSNDPNTPPSPPLGKAAEWAKTTCPACGGRAQREVNTMPQWAGSCWYYLRFLDRANDDAFCGANAEKYWMAPTDANPAGGVDLYVGGAEHAVLHLLYARFWHKVLFDLGHVSVAEPFGRLFNQGMIRSFAYRDGRGAYVGYDDVDISGDVPVYKETGGRLTETVEKMSKSLKNVVNPDQVIESFGADTFRMYEMFMGPLEASKPWNPTDVPGVHRFLHRVWRLLIGDDDIASMIGDEPDCADIEKALHKLIKKVGEDIEAMKFNTAIAAMMEFINIVYKATYVVTGVSGGPTSVVKGFMTRSQAERFVVVLSPFAPHLGEELWQRLGHDGSIAYEPWPAYDEAMLTVASVEMSVQINGKNRARITVPADADNDTVLAAALAEPRIAELTAGKNVIKKIVVPGRLVNLVVK